MLLHPRQSFSLIAARPSADQRFQSRTIVIASLILAAPNAALLKLIGAMQSPGRMAPWRAVLDWTVTYLVLAASIALLAAAVLTILTDMERVGTGVLSRTRSWRIPPPVANAICSHASVGWLAGAIAAAFLAIISNVVLRRADPGALTARVFFGVAAWGQVAAMSCGLMVFETWAYLGVRACRFANMPDESEVEPAPGSGNPSGV